MTLQISRIALQLHEKESQRVKGSLSELISRERALPLRMYVSWDSMWADWEEVLPRIGDFAHWEQPAMLLTTAWMAGWPGIWQFPKHICHFLSLTMPGAIVFPQTHTNIHKMHEKCTINPVRKHRTDPAS